MRPLLLLAVVILAFSQDTPHVYNEAQALEYAITSAYSYCTKIEDDDCGMASKRLEETGQTPIAWTSFGGSIDYVNAVIVADNDDMEIRVAFSGTQNGIQLAKEVVNNLPTSYDMHDIEGAKVLSFFYKHYKWFADWLEDQLREIYAVHSDY